MRFWPNEEHRPLSEEEQGVTLGLARLLGKGIHPERWYSYSSFALSCGLCRTFCIIVLGTAG